MVETKKDALTTACYRSQVCGKANLRILVSKPSLWVSCQTLGADGWPLRNACTQKILCERTVEMGVPSLRHGVFSMILELHVIP